MKKNILLTFKFRQILNFVLLILALNYSNNTLGAYCNTPTSTVAITPTSTPQNTATYNSGRRAFTFNATAGCTYTFSTCGGSGSDTYLGLYSGNGGTLIASNDDFCGLQSQITWVCPANGAYSILLTRYTFTGTCASLNANTFMTYSVSCPAPCASNTVSFSVTAGSYPGEVSWNLVNSGGTTVATGGAPASQSLCLPTGCYTLNMFDSWGDGWNGANYTAVLGGTTISTGTLATGTSGSVQFGVNTSCTPPSAPANDLVCNATTIACGSTTAGTTVNATNTGTYEGVSFCGTAQSSSGVWYKFIGTGQDITASLCATAWDSKIQIYSGATCTALSCIGGVDDAGPACGGLSASYSWTSTLGTTYWINVSGYSATSAFSLALTCVTLAVPPANDLVCNATAIACGSTTAGSTINGTNSGTGENGACTAFQTMPGVWYVVPGNGQIMTASLCATSAWDSKIDVFSGPNCSALTCIGGVDDNGPACAGTMASYSWTSVVGTNYYILVHGFSVNSAFSLALSCTSPPPTDLTSVTSSLSTICNGQNTTLTANGAVGTVYWFTGGCGTSGQIATGNTLVVSPAATTTYYARNFNGGLWSVNCASITIVVNPNPVVNAGAVQTQCPGNINLSGTIAPMSSAVFSENFGGAINWTTNDATRWGVSSTANAGGTSPEAMFQYLSGSAGTFIDASIFSQAINATGVTGLTLAFNHNVDWFVGSFALSAEVSLDNVTWTPVWTLNPSNNVPITTVNGVNLSSMDNQVFYLRYRYNGDIWNIDYWYIDNISINGNATPASSWTSLPSGFTSTSLTPSFTVPSTTTFTLSSTVNGCTATDAVLITIQDIVNPTITAPTGVSVVADLGFCTATGVVLGTPTTSDNCSVAGFVNNAPASYPLGNTTVTWTVTDGSGNTSTSNQTVTVLDNQNPSITAPLAVTVNADASSCNATGVVLGTPTTSDNCSVAGFVNDAPASYPLGNTTVTWTVTDGSGNTSTSTQTVTVLDNQNPSITAPLTVTVSSDPGICSASGVNLGLPTTTDNCSVAGFVNDAPASYPLGNTTVTWTVTDGSGNTATATQTVTVLDTENPAPICQNVTIQLDVTGNATLTAAQVDNSSTDNCGIASLVVSQTAFDCSHVGLNAVTLTVTDNSSNISTCPSIITVEDNVAPIALCQNLTLPLDLSGNVTITPTQINNASTDNCGIASLSLSQTSFDCLNVGVNNLVLTVLDVNGNSSTCSSVFTLTDSSNPIFTYVPSNISENAVSNLCGRVITYDLPIFDDNCGVSMSQTDLSGLTTGDIFPVGVTTQTYSVTDNSGNSISASFTITIVDDQVPVITNCPANITLNSSSSNCGASVTWTPPAISDNCPGVQYTESNASGDFFPIGVTTVSYNATDVSGNTSSCSFTITVVDNVSPVIPTLATLTGACAVTATAPSTTDNCGGVIIGTTSNPLTYSTQGTSTITWNFTDAAGNTSSANQTVIVLDNVVPTITAPVAVSVSANAACAATGLVLGSPVTTDNCSAVTTSNNAPVTFPIGTTTVTWTAIDAAGNTASAVQLVTVTDNTLPTISAPPSISVPANASCVAYNVNLGNPITTDNCTVASVVNNGPSVYPLGATTVTWTVTDASGNTATANQTITVLDQALPIIVAPGNLTLAASISCSVLNASVLGNPFLSGNVYTSDNCTVAGINNNAPSSFPVGNTNVIWTVTDINGNIATATQIVTVVDITNPTITAPIAVSTSINTACTATGVALGTPITADNCVVASTTNNAPGSYPLGTTVVTWTVTDASGNTATANQVVTVTDNQNPTITAPSAIAATTNNGCVTLNVNLGTPTTGDNCSVASVTNNAPAAFNLGLTVVTWTVTDGSGNAATATQNVVITDNQNPTIVAPTALTVSLTSGCTATIASLGNAVTSDNCTVATVLNNAPATFPIGNTTVTWTVTDASGNNATATQIVTIVDNTNPTITAPVAVSVTTNTACTATGVALGTPITADNCSVASTTNNAPGSYPLGTTVVTWTITDASGNTSTATQTVTVTDNQNPTIVAPATVNVTTNNSCMALNVNLGTPVTTDNCSVVSVTNNAPSAFNIGTTIVTWTATDGSGLVAIATQNVVVTDIENPIIIAPTNINANSTAACAATGIVLGNATAIDNCTIATVVNNAPASYPVGTTTITWTATDASGNTATATQTVTINDVVNPTITAPADISAITNSGCTAVGLNLGTPVTADNCGVLSVVNDAPASFPVGMTFITWTVTDVNGNTTTTIQKVTIVDNINPTLTVGANVTVDANNNCTAFNVNLGTPVVADNCGIASLSNDAPTVYNLGTTTVTWIAIDNNGNSITAVQTVTVVDNTAPVIIAPASLNVTTNNNCVASGLTLGNPIATDNCTVATVLNNAPTDFPVGTTVVTWTVTDAAGNTATAAQSVNVTDAINPTAVLQNILVTLDSQGNATVTFADVDNGSSDNCGIASTMLSQSAFNCSDIGVNNVTVTITDNNTNTTFASVTVTIQSNGIDSDNDGIDDSCDGTEDPIIPIIPEAFTPNGNNINDLFVIGNLETFTERRLDVFNRYGNSVYESKLYQNDWAGTRSDNGQALPDGTYYYVLALDNGEIKKGFVYINRVKQ